MSANIKKQELKSFQIKKKEQQPEKNKSLRKRRSKQRSFLS
uniref:Uncharacterized protein n=1 Tax=Rhizophora mucronata TaxID=61149 RepID=A0A2P2MU94_RHIMU